MILVGDIGGTNTRLALIDIDRRGHGSIGPTDTFKNKGYSQLEEIVKQFLSGHGLSFDAACFGVAGPVHHGRCSLMNLEWEIAEDQLSKSLGIDKVHVINDLEATAYGIPWLSERDIDVLHPGVPKPVGHAVVLAPGTGLGEAGMYWDGKRHQPIATEGGHCEFAPRNKLERELAEYLSSLEDLGEAGHISYERAVSGPGLVNIYRFLRQRQPEKEPPWLTEAMKTKDPAAVVSEMALKGRDATCEESLDLFFELCGAEAGNLALKFMATGGVWLAGNIVNANLSRLKSTNAFMNGFTTKGRVTWLMRLIPVKVVLNDRAPLLGAARWALHASQQIEA